MVKRIASVGLLVVFFCGKAFAEFAIYTIDDRYEAVFPASPRFGGELGEGAGKHRSYNYTDESNLIVYTATYQVGKTVFAKEDQAEAISNYVKGQAWSVGGNVDSYSLQRINGRDAAVFLISFSYQGVPVRKHGVVSYKGGHFYQWAVQDIPAVSGLDGETVFQRYLPHFRVK